MEDSTAAQLPAARAAAACVCRKPPPLPRTWAAPAPRQCSGAAQSRCPGCRPAGSVGSGWVRWGVGGWCRPLATPATCHSRPLATPTPCPAPTAATPPYTTHPSTQTPPRSGVIPMHSENYDSTAQAWAHARTWTQTHTHTTHQRVLPGRVEVDGLVPGAVEVVGHDVDEVQGLTQLGQVQAWRGGRGRQWGLLCVAGMVECDAGVRVCEPEGGRPRRAGMHQRPPAGAQPPSNSPAAARRHAAQASQPGRQAQARPPGAPCQPLGPAPVAIVSR